MEDKGFTSSTANEQTLDNSQEGTVENLTVPTIEAEVTHEPAETTVEPEPQAAEKQADPVQETTNEESESEEVTVEPEQQEPEKQDDSEQETVSEETIVEPETQADSTPEATTEESQGEAVTEEVAEIQADSTPEATTEESQGEAVTEEVAEIQADSTPETTTEESQGKAVTEEVAEIQADSTPEVVNEESDVTEIMDDRTDITQDPVTEESEVVTTTEEVVENQGEHTPEITENSKPSEKDQQTANQANDYSGKTKSELIEILALELSQRPVQQLRNTVEAVKINFYKILRSETETDKNTFAEAGNPIENFTPETDPLELKLKTLISEYRTKRDSYISNIEQEKDSNYKAKLTIIEELKELSTSSETLHNTFTAFRDLQNKWKEIGLVPQEKLKDLWDTYHHHVENFYNFIKINKELRDIDLKRNLESKSLLCEEAEALSLDPSATSAFHKLQKLHDQWRETGPVALEYKDQIWERFKEASARINKRHQEYFDSVKDEQLRNLSLKEGLCNKIEEITLQPYTNRKEWDSASEQIVAIQKIWKTIGFAHKKDNTTIYERFRAACDKFFEAKREYFNTMKSEMDDNLQAKIDLCVQAEALADSDDWKATTEALIELQKKWKTSGAVSRKHSEDVWKRFRSACDKFFNRKSEHFSTVDTKFNDNLEAKKQLLEQFDNASKDPESLTFDQLKEFQRQWGVIGFVPIKQKDTINKQYKEVMDVLFSILRNGEGERRMDKFKERVSSFKDGGKGGKVNSEREKLYNKVRQIEADIQIWENNMGFFAKSKNADSFVQEVEHKIEKARAEIAEMIAKINLIDSTSNEN